ncbi:hypothetical protein JCM19238_1434 [Vibrio ponticus]|nr:hypothetical protein JCM19238_1434 [Vibrio ponticus]
MNLVVSSLMSPIYFYLLRTFANLPPTNRLTQDEKQFKTAS